MVLIAAMGRGPLSSVSRRRGDLAGPGRCSGGVRGVCFSVQGPKWMCRDRYSEGTVVEDHKLQASCITRPVWKRRKYEEVWEKVE